MANDTIGAMMLFLYLNGLMIANVALMTFLYCDDASSLIYLTLFIIYFTNYKKFIQ